MGDVLKFTPGAVTKGATVAFFTDTSLTSPTTALLTSSSGLDTVPTQRIKVGGVATTAQVLTDQDASGADGKVPPVYQAAASPTTIYMAELDYNNAPVSSTKQTLTGVDPVGVVNATSDASSVAVTPTGNIAATDVQAALAELDSEKQPLDSDLTAIAALSTTAYGRSLLAAADAAAGRTLFGLGTAATAAATDFQPVDSDLTAIAALSTTSYGRAFLTLADAAAGRTALGLGTAATVDTGTASGNVPLLGASGLLATARLGTGTADGTKVLKGDQTWGAAGGIPAGGTQSQVLAKNSGTDGDASWVTDAAGGGDIFRSGYYSLPLLPTGVFTSTSSSVGFCYFIPLLVPIRRAFDRIGVNLTASGSAGAVARLGIYANAGGIPGALILDAGTIDSSGGGGAKEITISQTLGPGLVWLAVVAQVNSASFTTYASTNSSTLVPTGTAPPTSSTTGYWYASGVTGALPSTAPTPAGVSYGPVVSLRAA